MPMGLRLEHDIVHLEGACPVEEAEPLLALLRAGPGRRVALEAAGPVHTAVLQVLLALRPALAPPLPGSPVPEGVEEDVFFHRWLRPLLAGGGSG